MKRIFIGVFPDSDSLTRLSALSNGLQKAEKFSPCNARWMDPSHFHLTFVFVGDFEESGLPELEQRLESIAGATDPMEVSFQNIGYFPDPKNPKVLWAGIDEPTGGLRKLKKSIHTACEESGAQLPDHRFLPHITLARFKSLRGVGAFQNNIRSYRGKTYGEWTVREFAIIESTTIEGEPTYTTLRTFALGDH